MKYQIKCYISELSFPNLLNNCLCDPAIPFVELPVLVSCQALNEKMNSYRYKEKTRPIFTKSVNDKTVHPLFSQRHCGIGEPFSPAMNDFHRPESEIPWQGFAESGKQNKRDFYIGSSPQN